MYRRLLLLLASAALLLLRAESIGAWDGVRYRHGEGYEAVYQRCFSTPVAPVDDGIAQICGKQGSVAEDWSSSPLCAANCSSLHQLCYDIASKVMLLSNSDLHNNHNETLSTTEAYGYGFIMVCVISLLSLLGVLIVPFLKRNSCAGLLYKYLITLMIAMGVSAMASDALLHLIPNSINLHSHSSHEEDEHETVSEREVVWKMCVVVVGMVSFFLLELFLHACSSQLGHGHSHGLPQEETNRHERSPTSKDEHVPLSPTRSQNSTSTFPCTASDQCDLHHPYGSNTCEYVSQGPPTVAHPKTVTQGCSGGCGQMGGGSECGQVRLGGGELEGYESEVVKVKREDVKGYGAICANGKATGGAETETETEIKSKGCSPLSCIRNIKPLAWVIIVGDSLHNFTDGIAIGAAISQSLGLALGTAIAILFHEIPHELSDYAILLHTGMTWYKALLLNFLSALTAIAGFFIGVAIGTDSEKHNDWMLAVIAGQFLYIALVDLLPEIIHSKEKGWKRLLEILMALIGFALGFSILLVLALYEDKLEFTI